MRRRSVVAGSLVLLAAALFAVYAAALFYGLNCDDPTQADCARGGLARGQFAVSLVGLVPAGLLVFGTATRRVRVAVAALVGGLLTYAAWGLLADATANGWDHLAVF